MNKLTFMFAGLSVALALSVSLARPALAATDTRPTPSTTCPNEQTTTSSVPESTTSSPSTSTSVPETSTSTVASTTTVEATTTTVEATTTTVPNESTTTIPASTTTLPADTTTTVTDQVTLIPATSIDNPFGSSGDITQLADTGTFPYWNVFLFAIGVLALGWAGVLLRKMAVQK